MTPLKMNSRTDFLQEFCLDFLQEFCLDFLQEFCLDFLQEFFLDFKECLKLSADDSSGSVL